MKDNKNVLKVFLYSSNEDKVNRCIKYYGLNKKDAINKIKQINNQRKKHYEYYTNRKWDDYNNYDLVVNVDKLGIGGTVKLIKNIVENN